jgi:hypothetical protein
MQTLTVSLTYLSVKLISSIGSSSNLSGKLCERDSAGSRTGERAPSSSMFGFSKMSSGRALEGLSGEVGDEIVSSVRGGEAAVWIVLALVLPNPGDVLDGSNRVKDFAVCTADGRDFMAPVETFFDISGVKEPARGGRENIQEHSRCSRELKEAYQRDSRNVVNKERSWRPLQHTRTSSYNLP